MVTKYTIIQFLISVLYTFELDFVFVCKFHSFHLHSDKEAIETMAEKIVTGKIIL